MRLPALLLVVGLASGGAVGLSQTAAAVEATDAPCECGWCIAYYGGQYPTHVFNERGYIEGDCAHSEVASGNCWSHPPCAPSEDDLDAEQLEALATALGDNDEVAVSMLLKGFEGENVRLVDGMVRLLTCSGSTYAEFGAAALPDGLLLD